MRDVDRKTAAEKLGVSLRTTFNLEKRGMPTLGKGRFDLDVVEAWYREFQARGMKPETLVDADIRLKTAQAELRELELARLRGELVPAILAQRSLEKTFSAFKSRLVSLPKRAVPRLKGCSGDAAREKVLTTLVHEALLELVAFDFGATVRGAAAEINDQAPDVDKESESKPAPRAARKRGSGKEE